MATAATIKKNIAKLEAALKSKATPKSLKPKLETQLVKSKAELSGMNKGTKPKTSSTKSTQTALQKLKAMVNKNKKYKTYKGAGVDLEKDADRPALRTGKRVTDGTHYPYKKGNVYYEYRANRIDVKQPPKKYPKLEKGGEINGNLEIVDFYVNEYPKDDIAVDINPKATFNGLYQILKNKGDAYKYIGVGDSVVRERVFQKLAEIKGVKYDVIYDMWMESDYAKGGVSDEVYTKGYQKFRTQEIEFSINYKENGKMKEAKIKSHFKGDAVEEWRKKHPNAELIGVYERVRFSKKEQGGYMAKGGEVDRERMYNFLKDDLVTLKKAIEENNQEEIDKFFSYWSYHLSSLEPKTGSKRMYNFLKDDLVGLEAATKELPSSKEETDRFFSYWNTHLKSLSDEDLMNMMAKGGEFKPYGKTKGKFKIEYVEDGEKQSEIWESKEMVEDRGKKLLKLGCTEIKITEMAKGGYYAEGGISDKEVAESNAEMVLSQIKAVKHHAQELSNVVSKNSDIEAWVVAKIERASTDLSDITHYLEFQTKKMAMGGEMHRTQE